jgi:hypothetical protein
MAAPHTVQTTFILVPPSEPAPPPSFDARSRDFIALGVPDGARMSALLASLTASLPLPAGLPHVRRVRVLPRPTALYALVLLCDLERLPAACGAAGGGGGCGGGGGAAALVRGAAAGSAAARAAAALACAPAALHVEVVRVVTDPLRERAAFEAEAARGGAWPMSFLPRAAAAPPPPPPLSAQEAAYFAAGLRLAAARAVEGARAGFAPAGAVLARPAAGGGAAVRGGGFSREAAGDGGGGGGGGCPAGGVAPFRSAVMEAVAAAAAEDARLAGAAAAVAAAAAGCGGSGGGGRRADAPQERAAAAAAAAAGSKRARSEGEGAGAGLEVEPAPAHTQYLSTGFDAFLTHEPSLVDAMALVHSRVSRVVYRARAAAGEGACEGWGPHRVRLHGVKALNHHFAAVYREAGEPHSEA